MSKVTVVASILAKPEHVESVKAELLKLIEPTRAEKGCINYDLHQDNENPAQFLFFENWESAETLEVHSQSAHLVAFRQAIEGKLETSVVQKMTQIG